MANTQPKVQAPSAVDLYLQSFLQENGGWRAYAKTYAEIAERVGVSKPQVLNLKTGTRGAGPETEAGFARLLCNGSVDALRELAKQRFGVVADYVDRYPARASAIKRLIGLLPPAVAEQLRSEQHKEAESWTEDDWLREALILKQQWLRRQEQTPSERAAEEHAALAVSEAAEKRGRPRLPRRHR